MFHRQNQRGTTSLHENLREENWPQECPRLWMKNEIQIKQQAAKGNLDEDDKNALNIALRCKFEVIFFFNIFIKL